MAASRASSRRATWSFWTRSVVRVKRTLHPFSTRASPIADAKWLFPPPGGPNRSVEPAVAGDDCHDLRLGDHRHRLEVEGVEGLSGRQSRLGEMALDAAPVSFCELMLGDRREEARGLPAFLVGLLGELRPDELDRGKAQLAEHDAEARGVDGGGRPHAASPVWPMPTRAS